MKFVSNAYNATKQFASDHKTAITRTVVVCGVGAAVGGAYLYAKHKGYIGDGEVSALISDATEGATAVVEDATEA